MDLVFKIFVYSWIISIFFGIIVAVSYPLFKEEIDNKYELFIPLYNLFGLCSFNGYDEKFGLLFLIPFINILFMMFMSYKLKDRYLVSKGFSIGLLLLPVVFMPILAYSNKNENESTNEEAEVFEVESESIKEEPKVEIKKVNIKGKKNKKKEKEEEQIDIQEDYVSKEEVDSIFKLQPKASGSVNNKPYKAKRVRVNEQFINSAPAEREKIEKVEKGDN